MREDILELVRDRKIPFLTHFTRLENLASTMQHGLLPRADVTRHAADAITNDGLRLDGRQEYNCLSVSFPNSLMFYRFRKDNVGSEWVVLLLPPVLLGRSGALFCKHNAADSRISSTDACALSTPAALAAMFDEIPNHQSRADQRLKDKDPTDVQAEILLPGRIEPEMIKAVVFPSKATRDANLGIIGDRTPYVSDQRGMYATREYFRRWGGGSA